MTSLAPAPVLATVVTLQESPQQLLKRADSLKASDYDQSIAILQKLGGQAVKLSPEQQLYWRYIDAWLIAYRGNYQVAIPLLNSVTKQSADINLRFRAGMTEVNLLGIAVRYQEAFSLLSELLNELPSVTDETARHAGLFVASQLYGEAGQYSLAISYANRFRNENSTPEGICKTGFLKLEALYQSSKMQMIDLPVYQEDIDACVKAGDHLNANIIRSRMAYLELHEDRSAAALQLLKKSYPAVRKSEYAALISIYDALLAKAYWSQGGNALAKKYALAAVNSGVKNEFTESLSSAYRLLYVIEKKQGDLSKALAYHERYMAADKGYLNDVSAKALAYQVVRQQVLAKKLQIETLNKQNRILQLQQALGKKAVETGRLYIVLLLTVLAFIVYVAYRIKRSQLRFMRMARRDGLTGLFSRQHFLDEAERGLHYCRKSSRDACLILIDLDYFKKVNDTHGHATGDEVLKRAVVACRAHLRSTDIFGRLGGEEFGILLPECTLEQVSERAEQLRLAIAEPPGEDDAGVSVTASFGVATTACSGYELRLLLIHADDALYQAKGAGRNRVVVFDCPDDLSSRPLRKSRTETDAPR